MTYAETIQFLYSLRWFGAKFGLENTLKLAALAGNPQSQLRFIHVAGTNGKGSTCAMLESIYRAAGLRVGLFTSPHLISFRERIQVNRQLISEADVVRRVADLRELVAAGFQAAVEPGGPPDGKGVATTERVENAKATAITSANPGGKMPPSTSGGTPDATDRRDAGPTFFEFVTVMALGYFAEQECDLVIWETGLGGRLDATNIVTPLASVITNIGLDHQQWLGDTLAKIAFEKAGIIKPGVPVLTATDVPEALAVIEEVAQEKTAPLTVVNADHASRITTEHASRITHHASLPGPHQQLNAALARATVQVLQPQLPVTDEQIRAGLARVNWPGRMQWITRPDGGRVLLDGAHNVDGVEALRAALLGENSPSQSSRFEPLHPTTPLPSLSSPSEGKERVAEGRERSGCPGTVHGEGGRRPGDGEVHGQALSSEPEHFKSSPPQSRSQTGAPIPPGAPLTLILGVLADKDWRAICNVLAPLAARVRLVAVGSERTADPVALAVACRAANPAAEVRVCETLAAALTQSERDPLVVITGSLYLVGAALEQLDSAAVPATDEKALNDWQPVLTPGTTTPTSERAGHPGVQPP